MLDDELILQGVDHVAHSAVSGSVVDPLNVHLDGPPVAPQRFGDGSPQPSPPNLPTRKLRPEDDFQNLNHSILFTNIENDEFSRLVEVRGSDP